MAKGDDIQEMLISFSVHAMELCRGLPKSAEAKNICVQLSRSACAAAPNYAEARGAESRNDFVHKLGITFKELNESEVWLKIIRQMRLVDERQVLSVLDECSHLCRIIAASRTTASRGGTLDKAARNMRER